MWYLIIIIIISIGVIVSFAGCTTGHSGCNTGIINNDGNSQNIPDDTIKRIYTRQEVIEKLEFLATTDPPEDLSEGAMCYKVASPPDRVEYVCPVCGEKTLYTGTQARFVEREISQCRGYAHSITELEIKFDESQYCRKCRPEVTDAPNLCVTIRFYGETDSRQTCPVNSDDLKMIKEFLSGSLTTSDDYDYESPLKNYIDRLEYLLGVKIQNDD